MDEDDQDRTGVVARSAFRAGGAAERSTATSRLAAAATALAVTRPRARTGETALRAGVSIGASMVLLAALGRADLWLYASLGGLTACYGRRPDGHAAIGTQAWHGVLLTAAAATGCLAGLVPLHGVVPVMATGLWAALGAALSAAQRWQPPGPLFPVLVVATTSAFPLGGLGEAVIATVTTAAVAGTCVLLAVVGRLLPSYGNTSPAPGRPRPGRGRIMSHSARCFACVVVAGLIAGALPGSHPYWAMVSSVVPMAFSHLDGQVVRAAHRAVGTVVGLGVAALLLALPLNGAAVIVVVVILQCGIEVLGARHYGAAVVLITPLALVLADGNRRTPVPVPQLLAERLLETLLGLAVGLVFLALTRRTRFLARLLRG